jgi:hypothetical protein
VTRQRLAHPGPGAVQQHPLIRHRDRQKITDLVRIEALDVPQRDDRSLRLGQLGDRSFDGGAGLDALQEALGILFRPGPGRAVCTRR